MSYVDALFTATTATCVTGLVTLPTVTTWSIFWTDCFALAYTNRGLGNYYGALGHYCCDQSQNETKG